MSRTRHPDSALGPAIALAVLLVPALTHAEPPAAQPPPASTAPVDAKGPTAPSSTTDAEARAFHLRGVDHIDKGEWQEAYDALKEAWNRKRYWKIAMALGWAELELGKVRAAIDHLTFAAADE